MRLIVFIVFLSLSPCWGQEEGVLEEIVEQNYRIDPGATLSIRNTDGSIRIYGADIPELRLHAVKKAYRQERLQQIHIDVSAQPNAVSIETRFPPKPKWGFSDRSGTVDYIVVLPQFCSISRLELTNGEVLIEGMRGKNVHASLANGRMFGHNCFGDVHFAVTNGGLDVAYHWWEQRPFSVDAEIMNGNVRAFIPGEASFHLLATSVNGNVASDFSDKQDRHLEGVAKIDTTVGGASEANVKIHATNGSVRIVEANP